jgi:uncharacterized RDD family membrane protein YckC
MNQQVRYAGFWLRVIATILDSIWLYGFIYSVLWVWEGSGLFRSDAPYTAIRFAFEWVVPLAVVMVFWIAKSSTPGKMIFQMRIVDSKTLQPVAPSRLLVRYLSYFVSMIPLFLGILWVGYDKKKQGWHDKIAGTVVVRGGQA